MRKLIAILICFFFFLHAQASDIEENLIDGLEEIQTGKFNAAWSKLNDLAEKNTKYKLAQLLKAELLAIKSGNLSLLKEVRIKNNKKLMALLSEAKVRLKSKSLNQQHLLLEQYVLKANQHPHLIIVDTEANRLYVYQNTNNGYDELGNYYITIGKKGSGKDVQGDLRTPIGIYKVEKELQDQHLGELYGVGALTLNYPNKWDQKKGRTGSGIWLHGTPRETFSRSPLDSRGCVVLNNVAMSEIMSKFNIGASTPVIIVDKPSQLNEIEFYAVERNQQILREVSRWLKSQSDTNIEWETVSVFSYPGEDNLYYISFKVKEQGKYKLVEKFWKASTVFLASID